MQALVSERKACGAWPMGAAGDKAAGKLLELNTDYLFLLAGQVAHPKTLLLQLTAGDKVRLAIAGEALLYHSDGGQPELILQSASSARPQASARLLPACCYGFRQFAAR